MCISEARVRDLWNIVEIFVEPYRILCIKRATLSLYTFSNLRKKEERRNPNHAKPHKCCTSIAPQVVLHLQLLRHKILSHLALQAKYRQSTQPHWHHTTVYPLSPTGIMETVYSALQALCKQYTQPHRHSGNMYTQPDRHHANMNTQPHRHCANSILSPTGIMQTVYSAPKALCRQYIQPHRH